MVIATIDDIYGAPVIAEDELLALLDRSRSPRSPEMLYDLAAKLGSGADTRVLDVGCRDARHSCEIARRLGCPVLGVDPVAHNISQARRAIQEVGLGGRVEVIEGRVEA